MTKRTSRTLAIGLTGGIGSGKSEACKIFQSLGVCVLSADTIARHLIDSDPEIKRRIQKVFGKEIYSEESTLNRRQMAELIFKDPTLQKALERIVHPHVIKYTAESIKKEKKSGRIPILVVEAALHYEAGVDKLFDYMIVVHADEEKRIGRVMQRDSCTRREVLQRIKAQMPAKEKARRADFVINNNGNRPTLVRRCRFIYQILTAIAGNPVRGRM